MSRQPRYPFPHRLPVRWKVERDQATGKPVILAVCVMPGGAEYATWHPCNGFEAPMLLWMVIETLTFELLYVCGTSEMQPVGIMRGTEHA